MNVVILAAGLGKRMKSAMPKVLHPVAGRPMLAHVIAAARAAGRARQQDTRVTVVVGHGAERVRKALSDQPDLHWVSQEPQLGTGHAVQQAVPELDDSAQTLVLYGDVPLVTAETLIRLLDSAAEHVGLLTVQLTDPHGYGRVIRDAGGNVLRIVEHKDADAAQRAIGEVNTGILVAPTPRLKTWLARLSNDNSQREYYLTDVIGFAVTDGVPVTAVLAHDEVETLGVNSKAQLAQLERHAQSRIAAALMEAGATLADPARIDVRGSLTVGRDVFIDVNCVFEGSVELGDGVHIGPHNVLRDVRIGAHTEVLGFCYLESARIGMHGRIGPFARTRPDVELGDEVHIGNFVEVKNSTLGTGSKANHLAYVGDAEVGSRVNIGAGTIVANYDGAAKHRTIIEDDVHTGSNSVLVAPVRIGAGATVGAGSTVTREVPAGKLTVARAPQTTIEGWQRPVKKKRDP